MGAENWIDKVVALWNTVDDGAGRKVRAYRVFGKNEFPEAVNEFPCAITWIPAVPVVQYSAGGPATVLYRGITEFHLYKDTSKTNYPGLIKYIDRIIQAAASSVTLGGIVSHFLLAANDPLVPGVLVYGSEEPHHGIVVNWVVKENPVFVVEA